MAENFDPNSNKIKKYGMRYCIERYKYLLDAPFLCGKNCCDIMKKNPAKRFERETGKHPYIGTMTEESKLRENKWLEHGCNAFNEDRPISNPISFWTKSDILEYIVKYNVPYVKDVYGDIVEKDGKYTTTGVKRTGCVFCAFGCHLGKEPNKFQQLAITHPQLYDYCMRGGKYNENGMWIPDGGAWYG